MPVYIHVYLISWVYTELARTFHDNRIFNREVLMTNSSIQHVNRNIYKPKVSEETKRALAEAMSREVEFYNFCRQRLRRQATVIG